MLFSCISRKLVTASEFDLKMAAAGKCRKHRGSSRARVFVPCACADGSESEASSRISVFERFRVDGESTA